MDPPRFDGQVVYARSAAIAASRDAPITIWDAWYTRMLARSGSHAYDGDPVSRSVAVRGRVLLPLLLLGIYSDGFSRETTRAPSSIARKSEAEEYEELLMRSLGGWDEFRKRFKDLADVTVTKDGNETVLRGTAWIYYVEHSTFEARFASPTKITKLVATLDPANPRNRRLRSDLSNRIAKGQPDLEEWLPKPVRDRRDDLLVERIDIEFGEGNAPTRASLISKIAMPFEPVPGLGIRTDSMEFLFSVTDPGNRDRVGLSATLAGTLKLGSSRARLSGTIQSRDSRESWSMAAELGDLQMGTMLESIVGQAALSGIIIPREIGALGLRKTVLQVDQGQGTASIKATSLLGDVEFKAAKSKTGGAAAFQLGVAPGSTFKFASLAPELGVMDGLGLENTAVVIASEATRTDLSVLGTAGNGQDVGRGVTMMGGFNLRSASPTIADLLKVDALVMRAAMGASMTDMRLEAKVDTRVALAANDALVLRGIVVKLMPNPAGAAISLGGLIDVKADRQVLTFGADVGVDFTGPQFYVQGKLVAVDNMPGGVWVNPFGISKGLQMKDLALALGINFGRPIPLPMLALQGELIAGDMGNPDFRGRAVIGIDMANPSKAVIDLGMDQLTVRQILGAAAPQSLRSVPRDMQFALNIGLHDARITVVPSPTGADLFGNHYDPGFLVQGRATIGEWSGELYVAIDYDKGIEGRASLDAISLPPWFSLTGARGAPNPYINVRIGPSANSFVAMSGLVNVLGMQAETDVLIYAEGFDFYLAGKVLNGAFQAKVEVAGGNLKNGGTLYAIAEMQNDLFQYMTTNASQQINAATKDMQAKISDAQREVATQTTQIRNLDGQIAQYTQQLEANRNQVCLDIRNGNGDVRAKEQELARYRASLNNLPNDPGVVAARNRMVAAEQTVASARATVNNLENDPGVVRARNDLVGAEQTLARAQGAVAALDNDPGVLNARRDLNNAEAKVNTLTASVNQAWNELNALKARLNALRFPASITEGPPLVAQIAAKGTEHTGLVVARGTALGALDVARGTMNGSIQAAQAAANGGLVAAQRTVQASRYTYDGAVSAARQTATFALQTAEGTVATARDGYNSLVNAGQVSLQGLVQGAEGSLQVAQAGAKATYDACVATPIIVDPRLLALKGSQEGAIVALKGANVILEGIKQAATGNMVAAEWIVKNGNPLGVVNIEYAKFEGCLATMDGGKVSLDFRGKFAGNPIQGSLDLNIASPLEAVTYLAEYLLQNKTAPRQLKAGTCAKPTFAGRPAPPQRGGEATRLAANPSDLKGASPAVAEVTVPAGLGVVPSKRP